MKLSQLLLTILNFLMLMFALSTSELNSDWWKHHITYEVYVRSFKDSDGDGKGDLKGVTSKLDYLVDLGVDTIWLSPFFKSPMEDWGYDVANYTDIEPIFGTMADFDELSHEMEKRGLNLLLDFVINHCSDEHEWFKKSIDGIKPYDEYFIWKDPKGYDEEGNPIPPNNWRSLFKGGAWEWNEKRKQFYYHQFATKQPDFNLRNPIVKEEIKNILRFWFSKGVDGVRLDATPHYMEDPLFRDEPYKHPELMKGKILSEIGYEDLQHIYTMDLWELYEFIHELREFVDDFNANHGGRERILIAEAYTTTNLTMAYYGTKDYKIIQYPFNFGFVAKVKKPVTAKSVNEAIWDWLKNMPKGGTPNWVSDNHDNFRMASRFSEEVGALVTLVTMLLPGAVCIYYGQEIGMLNGPIRKNQIQDRLGTGLTKVYIPRDFERTPMQWDNSMNAGFTTRRKSWLPVNPNYYINMNVEEQKKRRDSQLNLFKRLSQLRKLETFKNGDFEAKAISEWVHLFSRHLSGHPSFYVVANFGNEHEILELEDHVRDLPPSLTVDIGSVNSGYEKGQTINTKSQFPHFFILKPHSAVVLTADLET